MSQPNSVTSFLKRSKRTALIMALTVIITLAAVFLISWWFDLQTIAHFPSFGVLRAVNVKAYWDENKVNETKEISWGVIYPGSLYRTTLYLQSLSTVDTKFVLHAGNWTFRNSHGSILLGPLDETSYMNLTWDYDNTVVEPKETVQVTLTLGITDSRDYESFLLNDDAKGFSVEISISAVEQ